MEVKDLNASAEHKSRNGLTRLAHAAKHSFSGLTEAWNEKAFRLEIWLAIFMTPLAFMITEQWFVTTYLIGTIAAVLIIELINTAIESVVDRVGLEWNPLAKRAKDIASCAVLFSLLFCGFSWIMALNNYLL